MLILSRKPGERMLVGEDVEVVVLEVEGGRVKLGFESPAIRAHLPGRDSPGTGRLSCRWAKRRVIAVTGLSCRPRRQRGMCDERS